MPTVRPRSLLAVFAGGCVGTAGRWLMVRAIDADLLPTFIANVAGSLVLGLFAGWWVRRRHPGSRIALFVGVGALGSFTTFSTFSLETVDLLREGTVAAGIGYAFVSVVAGLAAMEIGAALGARS